jgi:HSP20 family protein
MANALQTWDPVRELGHLRHDFDEMIERLARPPWLQKFAAAFNEPPIESFIDNDKLVVRAELPGVDPKDVEVTISGNMLTIRASREERHEKKDRDFLHREISYGKIERTLSLPPGVTGENVKASYRDGILELTIPLPKELSTRKVPVQADSGGRSK